jgi:hypothetical protein
MRRTFFLVLVALSFSCGVSSAPESEPTDVTEAELKSPRRLTSAQRTQAIKAIDDFCGDTWCEGDWGLRFDDLVCRFDHGRCLLVYSAWPTGETGPVSTHFCLLRRISSFEKLIAVDGDVTEGALDQIGDCINSLDSSLP